MPKQSISNTIKNGLALLGLTALNASEALADSVSVGSHTSSTHPYHPATESNHEHQNGGPTAAGDLMFWTGMLTVMGMTALIGHRIMRSLNQLAEKRAHNQQIDDSYRKAFREMGIPPEVIDTLPHMGKAQSVSLLLVESPSQQNADSTATATTRATPTAELANDGLRQRHPVNHQDEPSIETTDSNSPRC